METDHVFLAIQGRRVLEPEVEAVLSRLQSFQAQVACAGDVVRGHAVGTEVRRLELKGRYVDMVVQADLTKACVGRGIVDLVKMESNGTALRAMDSRARSLVATSSRSKNISQSSWHRTGHLLTKKPVISSVSG